MRSPLGDSTLITSAPWSASIMVATGPATIVVRSSMRTPFIAPGMSLLLGFDRCHWWPASTRKVSLEGLPVSWPHSYTGTILMQGVRQRNTIRDRPIEASHKKDIGDAELIAHQVSPRLCDPGGHRLRILHEVVPRSFDSPRCSTVDMLEPGVAPHDV